jgi:environmental stress-induced protein Ves
MRWKNGGGETAEIAVSPPGAALDAFDWRLSMARVETDGPFSAFPGIDRTLVILEGEGIRLAVGDGTPVTLTQDCEPHAFPADTPAVAHLVGGPVADLNFMSRRGRVRHSLARLRLTGPADIARVGDMVIFCAEGSVILETGDGSAELAKHDTAVWTDGSKAILSPQPRALIYLVKIDRG